MKKQLIAFFGVISLFIASFTVNAADGDTDLTSFQYGVTGSVTNSAGSAFGVLSIENNGHNRTAYLTVSGHSNNNGGSFNWSGDIPLDAVKVNGVSDMSVELDTCSYPGHGHGQCGYLNFTIITNVPASGWIEKGSRITDYGLYYVRTAGSIQARSSTSSGYIFDIPLINSSRAYITKGQDVEIELVTKP